MSQIETNYVVAQDIFAAKGIDSEQAMATLRQTPISVHCWQIDDLTGFESFDSVLTGGIQATGNAPGKPRSIEEYIEELKVITERIGAGVRQDIAKSDAADSERMGTESFGQKGRWLDPAKTKKVPLLGRFDFQGVGLAGFDQNALCRPKRRERLANLRQSHIEAGGREVQQGKLVCLYVHPHLFEHGQQHGEFEQQHFVEAFP